MISDKEKAIIVDYLISKMLRKLDEEQCGLQYLLDELDKQNLDMEMKIGTEPFKYYKASLLSSQELMIEAMDCFQEVQEELGLGIWKHKDKND
jgi:hypothetical protein